MFEMLPREVRDGLAQARKQSLRRGHRLCVHDGDQVHRISRLWDDGFAVDASKAVNMRGRVAIYDGSRPVYQCLVLNSERNGDEQIFDFKWLHAVPDRPPADFVRDADAPIAMITREPTANHETRR